MLALDSAVHFQDATLCVGTDAHGTIAEMVFVVRAKIEDKLNGAREMLGE